MGARGRSNATAMTKMIAALRAMSAAAAGSTAAVASGWADAGIQGARTLS